jgi:hypothetical protein
MLGRLIKYEFKATAKIILLFYAALLVVAVINFFVMPWTDTGSSLNMSLAFGDALNTTKGVLQGMMMVVYLLFTAATIAVSYVVVVMRFYRMLGDEGYLMFTLPVTTTQHIFSKLIVAVVWNVLSLLLVGLSALIVIGRADVISSIPSLWSEAVANGIHPGIWLLCIGIYLLFTIILSILQFYTAIAIGPHITKSRIGGSIIAYIIVYVAAQLVSTIGMVFMMLFMSNTTYDYTYGVSGMREMTGMINSMAFGYFVLLTAVTVVAAIPCYFITHHMIDKKLNLG